MSRRDDLLLAALAAFQERGFDGTSIADLVDRLDMTKGAFGYHIESKDQLLVELVEPLLADIEAALEPYPRHPSWPGEGRRLLASYLDALIAHRAVVIWVDADRAVLGHPIVGKRLAESNRRVREAIRGDNRSTAARLGASAALGTLWRPLRNMSDLDAAEARDAMLAAALAVIATVRSS